MKTKTYPKRRKQSTKQSRADIYTRVTDAVIERLEQGATPWRSPYLARAGFPRNFSSDRHYRGINVFLLAMLGYESPYFLTYRQAQELGGQVRKGEKGAMIVKAGTFVPKDAAEQTRSDHTDADAGTERWYLKGYTVFNASQIDGIEFPSSQPDERTGAARIAQADQILSDMKNPPHLDEGAFSMACYVSSSDTIRMPRRSLIASDAEYYSTLFHELTHATGHPSRLDRESLTAPVSIHSQGEDKKTYSKEELIAEMGASFLCGLAGIETQTLDNSAAYIQNWLTVLKAKDNSRWLVSAAAAAQKATDHILGA